MHAIRALEYVTFVTIDPADRARGIVETPLPGFGKIGVRPAGTGASGRFERRHLRPAGGIRAYLFEFRSTHTPVTCYRAKLPASGRLSALDIVGKT
ncbi:hypothetical protein [Burkholderia ambifaria]|uniref:hypothetical protein n=1 Tax=Burkholderia ambifaria TaxID=152480 RepID=UPI0015899BBD|nr:hypothetical protein [Burkholderia ambifaria]